MSKRLKLSSQFLTHKHNDSSHSFEDGISQLPDDILVTILSRVTLREAAQTSILSRRWKNLWTFSTRNLDFDAPDAMYKIRIEMNHVVREKERCKYTMWVNQVLKSHKAATVNGFRICFDLNNTHKSNVDNWIDFAIQKRATRLEVDLKRLFNTHGNDYYPFPKQVLGFTNIKLLRSLRLTYVDVSGPVLEDLLSKCSSLEALSVSRSQTLLGLKVCGGLSLKLKFLEIQYCQSLEYLEVSAGNLMVLAYSGPNISLGIIHAPKLHCMFLGGDYCMFKFPKFCELSPFFSQIETLALDYSLGMIWCIPSVFPEFRILKHLDFSVLTLDVNSLLPCISLIKACPMLRKLGVQFEWRTGLHTRPKERKLKRERHELKCLKVVEFRWFVARTTDVELVISLLENSPHLEKITIDTRSPHAVGTPSGVRMDEKRRAAREVGRRLANIHSPRAKLILP